MAELDDDQLCNIVFALVKEAEDYRDERAAARIKAMAYFDGDAGQLKKYIPYEEKRSKVVSRDVRASIKKVLPSLYRTILGNDQIVEYSPVGEGDEQMAEQATDYINHVVMPECGARRAIEDAINDAVRLRNGIIRWWQETSVDVKTSLHTGLDEIALVQLLSGDNIEVLEHTERAELVDGPQGPQETTVHDVRIKRRIEATRPRIAAIKLEDWLIHPDAIRLDESPILGEKTRLRRSDLVRMGFDRATVWKLPAAGMEPTDEAAEEDARRRDVERREDAPQKALEEIEVYDLLVRVDRDGDGIAELRRMVFAGGIKAEYLLEDTEWDEINYADIICERRPHQWEGNSVSDDVEEIQTVKTVLLRQTLDNLYWQNNLQPIVEEGGIVNPESVTAPEFGLPIRVAQGRDVRTAVGYNVVPMVADKSFAMLEYMDQEATDRTGISDASSGMAPDALQNMTARASAMIEQAGIEQTEMMVRCIADSLKPVFRGLLRLIIQHQDKPRTVRLRNEWVTFDPRMWNAEMDAVVNVGLGAGTRERDMMAMQQVITLQREILAAMGPAAGTQYVTPENLYNAISKFTEAVGLKSVGLYFSKPDPQAIQQAMSQKQPNPEEIKAQAAMQLEQMRGQQKMQLEQVKGQQKQAEAAAKMQVEANKEREQRDADLATNIAEMERQSAIDQQQIGAEMVDHEEDRRLERDRMALDYRMHREELDSREAVARENASVSMQKAAMSEAGRAQDRQQRGAAGK